MEISTLGTISILPVGVEESKRTTARMPLSMHSAERNRVVLMTEFEYRGCGVCSALAGTGTGTGTGTCTGACVLTGVRCGGTGTGLIVAWGVGAPQAVQNFRAVPPFEAPHAVQWRGVEVMMNRWD